MSAGSNKDSNGFSLVQGGPLFWILLRIGALKSPADLANRAMILFPLVAWLPLLLLTALTGDTIRGTAVPFIQDIGAQVRLLMCLPLLLVAEVTSHRLLAPMVRNFVTRGLVAPEDLPRFTGFMASAHRLRDSVPAEVVLLLIAILGGYYLEARYISMSVPTWFGRPVDGHTQYTAAGYWYHYVSLALFRFIWLRWCFRLFIWYRFLWQVARHVRLVLNPLHPDRAGGLGFLMITVFAFYPLLLSQTLAISGVLGGKIWHEGATLPQFKLEITAWIIFLILLVLTPLCFFVVQLLSAKAAGLAEYGSLAHRYVNDFRRKWIEPKTGPEEALLGSADIQSLADLGNSYEIVREMRMLPFGHWLVLRLALVLALPLAPLTLTMVPLEELIDRAVQMLF